MKNLIENSIQIYGIGHPDTITIFNMKSEEDRNHPRFKNLEVLKNRTLTVWFDYQEEGSIVKEQSVKMTIPNESEENIINNSEKTLVFYTQNNRNYK